jgi:TatD DNase family protein
MGLGQAPEAQEAAKAREERKDNEVVGLIDSHCHVEWKSYDADRDALVSKWKTQLKAVVSACSRPHDFDKALTFTTKYPGFVFVCAGFHPEFMKEVSDADKENYLEKVRKNKDKIVTIGEIGLDYAWLPEPSEQEKSRKLFEEMLELAKELNLPVVIHSRNSHNDVLNILEKHRMPKVYLHMWGGHQDEFMKRVIEKGYFVGANTIIYTSKNYKKVVRDIDINRLLLETDAPWLSLKKEGDAWKIDPKARNEPTSIRMVAEKIAEIKGVPFEEVWKTCAENAIRFYSLPF